MQFNGFKKDGIKFLKDLGSNNSKEWFIDHRHLWQKHIQDIDILFIEEMGEHLQALVPTIHFRPKVGGSLFKIYRDVRFSKDKTPMKSKIGLLFWQGSGHRMQSSSFYMHYDKDEYFIASGIRNFKTDLLKIYREYIKNDLHRNSLHLIMEELKDKGYLFGEPKFKRLPKGLDKNLDHIHLALYSSMFAYKSFKIDDVFFSEKIVDRCFKIYDDMRELQEWVYKMSISNQN
ncbi:MAG: TIGR02453 family protein [Helicobacteraceae bacterium]|nr:TIGR02453 family protein [Helicobacteraceae bacterium]